MSSFYISWCILNFIDPEYCTNKYDRCEEWARKGHCRITKQWMRLNCRLTCHKKCQGKKMSKWKRGYEVTWLYTAWTTGFRFRTHSKNFTMPLFSRYRKFLLWGNWIGYKNTPKFFVNFFSQQIWWPEEFKVFAY